MLYIWTPLQVYLLTTQLGSDYFLRLCVKCGEEVPSRFFPRLQTDSLGATSDAHAVATHLFKT